jgi:hypothetical protein
VNTGDPGAAIYWAERRVLKIQTKLYQGACHTHLGLAVAASLVGVMGAVSLAEGSRAVRVPDFDQVQRGRR